MNLALRPATHEALERFRLRRQKLLQARAILCGLAVALATFVVIALLDRAWFMPDALRPWVTILAYGVAVYAAWKVAWRFIDQSSGKEGTARLIESAEPALRDRILAAVELADPRDGEGVKDSVEFREKLQEDVAGAVEGIDWKSRLPATSLKPWFLATAGVMGVVLILCFVPGLHLGGFMARAALPFANLERPASLKIKILEPAKADALAPIGSEVPLIVETDGATPEVVTLELQAAGAKPRRSELAAIGATRFESILPVGQSDLRYRIHAGDAISTWRTISARPRPRVVEFVKTIVPPAYTGAKEVTVTEDHGDLEAIDGSTVKLTLKTNQPVVQSDLLLNPETSEKSTSLATLVDARRIDGELTVRPETLTWQVALKSEETGFTNEESTPWRIISIPDLPPTAQINEPARQIELLADEAVRISGTATDDVGLGGVKLAHAINGANWTELDLPFTASAKEAPVQTLLPLPPLGVRPGDAVILKLIASDLKGQKTESQPVRVLVLEQTIDPRQRQWAESQRRLAQRAERLNEQAHELRKEIEQVRKVDRNARKDSDSPKTEAESALAAAQEKLERVKEEADEVWEGLKEASRDALNQLDAAEAQLLGERLSQMRRESLQELEKLNSGTITNTDPLKRAASEAASTANLLADATRAFAAEDAAKIAAKESQQLQRQSKMLTENALAANRDAEQRPKWQEQQRALMAQAQTLQKDLRQLDEAQGGRQQKQLQDLDKKITETAEDLAASLDKADQTKSPEHLYGASDNMRNRLQQTADATRAMAEQSAGEAAKRREQLNRLDNPALAKLEEARNNLASAENEARTPPRQNKKNEKENEPAVEKAQKDLAEAAKQLQDQAELREQNQATNTQAALDMNRASRAADELARQVVEAAQLPQPTAEEAEKARKSKAPPSEAEKALQNLKDQAAQLALATRALDADALAQDAAQALEAARSESMRPQNQQDVAQTEAQAQAAAEALKQLPEQLNRARLAEALQKDNPQAANELRQTAQQAADTSRQAAEANKQVAQQAAQQQPGQPLNTEPAQKATAEAQMKANELAAQLQPQVETAREQLAAMTPGLSEMMKRVAEDLKETQQETQTAANDAKAEKPVEEVAEKAQELRPEAAENAEKMASLQAALRQEANAADLAKKPDAQLARTADVALAQMQQKTPEIAENLKQAAQATQSQPQAKNLQAAADAQQQTAQALEQIAQNMEKMEQGQQLSEAELAAMQQMEQDLGVQEPLDEAYQRAEELAQMAQDATQDPQAVLAALEKELPKNPSMQKALADVAKGAAQQAEQAVAQETKQAVQNGMAQKQAANDLARVSRHQERLGDKEAAQQVAQASQQLEQAGKQAEATQANPVPNPQASQHSQASAAQAAKAAEATAAQTAPPLFASPLEQLQGQMLAQALDQLDAQLHPMQGGQQQAQDGQQQQQNGQQQGQQAQNSLNQAQQAQQQSMADSRNQGQTPGQKPSQQQMAQNQQQQGQNTQAQSAEGGNQSMELTDGEVGQLTVLAKGDWGHLPQKMAADLTEATRSEAAPEYRAAIESYYKAIAQKARK